ncbi:glycoside hydrolase family 28 protein [Niabella soli]|uniref:glycoside hydrolase family 28 protein n=1 Tax=Niabella soli TaxID=446683 RepID=UPI001FE0AEC0|nr:glycosyl hydrolase family 28 protein [Niabella soli]
MLLLLLFLGFAAQAADIKVTDYGAKGDGTTLNTVAIQKAIDACNAKGGGHVIFPAGRYVSGTVLLKNNVTLQLEKDAWIIGSTDVNDYTNPDPFKDGLGVDVGWALIAAVDVKNVGIVGAGGVDGQGSKLKERQILTDTRPESQRWGRRPFLLRVVRCDGVLVKGVSLNYSAAWTSHYFQSRNLQLEQLKIRSTGVAHNDGIDIDGCQEVRISNCDIVSGDDALCFKTTSSKMKCNNIIVSDMKLKSNQAGIKMGTESMAGFENISIRNCVIYDTKNGGIKLLSVDGAQIRNVIISDIKMMNIRTPILLRLGVRLSVFRKGQDVQQKTGLFEKVVLKNIEAVSADSTQLKAASGILITGIPEHKLSGVTLENIRIELPGGGTADEAGADVPEAIDKYPEVKTFGPVIPAYGIWARHVSNINIKNVSFRLRRSDGRPAVLLQDAQQLRMQGSVLPATKGAVSVFEIKTSRDVVIERSKVGAGPEVFIKADGISKGEINSKENQLPPGMKKR